MVKTRNVVGAHYGLGSWLLQRVTAIVMALYTLLMVGVLLVQPPSTYLAWKDLFGRGWVRLATLLFFASMMLHAWVGMRDVVMDYIKPTGLRFAFEIAFILALVVYAAWAVQILWRG